MTDVPIHENQNVSKMLLQSLYTGLSMSTYTIAMKRQPTLHEHECLGDASETGFPNKKIWNVTYTKNLN